MALALPRYETNQLISIIGSKRPISDSLRLILSSLTPKRGTPLFLDPFCGSGVVSRLARGMGMAVRAGDTQPFSYLINHVYLSLENDDLNPMLPEMGGIDAYFSLLNMQGLFASESASALARPFLSRYYAPQDDEDYDGKRERLFFTAANARFLDAVREVIETDWIEGRISANEKAVVLASILYEASRKANTSGSFTAYHKSFASAGNVIRKRIVEPCLLTPPVLPDAEVPRGEMNLCEASEFVKRSSADICYLDPPATVHQYGSTYHLLNTITMWDDFIPSNQRDKEGQLLSKAGIRSDWKQTHSPFCSLSKADKAFVHLLGSIDARHIVLTYPASGIVEIERIHELLMPRHQPVTVIPLYKRNQGGRQRVAGNKNIEYVFITGKSEGLQVPVGTGLKILPLMGRLDELSTAVFRTPQNLPPFQFIGGVMLDGLPRGDVLLNMALADLEKQVAVLETSACTTEEEALEILVAACIGLGPEMEGKARARLEKRLYALLRKITEKHTLDKVEMFLAQSNGDVLACQRIKSFLNMRGEQKRCEGLG